MHKIFNLLFGCDNESRSSDLANLFTVKIWTIMKIFNTTGRFLTICTDTTAKYFNADVVEGGYAEGSWYAVIKPHNGHELEFKIDDPDVYNIILHAYLEKRIVGIVL